MGLRVWLPLNGDIKNYGASDITTSLLSGTSYSDSGKIGKALYNSGDGQGVNLQNCMSKLSQYTKYSMCAWVYMTSTATNHSSSILSSGNWNTSASQCCFGFYNYSNGYGTLLCPNKSGWSGGISLSSKIQLVTWYHVCITYDGTTTKGYINGSYVGSYANGGITASSETNNAYVGSATYYTGFTLKGYINDFRIYDHCLSYDEVKEISKALVLHYPLNDPENQIVNSYSITGGSNSSGLTSEYLSNGSMKVVANGGSWRHCLFSNNEQTAANFQNNITGGHKLTISYDLLIESGTLGIPTMFLNANNSYAGFTSEETLVYGKWIRVHQNRTYTTVTDTSYGHFSMHLNFGSLSGTYYVRAFRVEHGTKSQTTWATSIYDSSSNLIIKDNSGYNRHGSTTNSTCPYVTNGSSRNETCYHFTAYTKNLHLNASCLSILTTCSVSWWAKIVTNGTSGTLPFGGQDSNYFIAASSNWTGAFYHNKVGSGTIKCYIDGVEDNTPNGADSKWHHYTITGLNLSEWTALRINDYGNSNNVWNAADIYYSDVKFYNTVLSANDISKEYHNFASIYNDGSLSAYDFLEV